jgi:hypothetical protein
MEAVKEGLRYQNLSEDAMEEEIVGGGQEYLSAAMEYGLNSPKNQRGKDIFLFSSVQTSSGVYLARGLFP